MANTREVMGEQACLDALVANTLTSFEDDGIKKVGKSCMRYHTNLLDITLGQCSSVETYGLSACDKLKTVDILGTGTIGPYAFESNHILRHLVLRGSSKTTLSDNAFKGTPIDRCDGAVYVNESQLSSYKADDKWRHVVITTLDKYPLTSFESIDDDWETIIAKAANGTASQSYSIGDTKLVDLGTEGKVHAQIVAFDSDILSSDTTNTAGITFVAKEMLNTRYRMNLPDSSGTQGTGANGGWEYSDMRTYLTDTIFPLFPSVLRTAIKEVVKYSDYVVPGDSAITHDQQTNDKLWIPSAYEMIGGSKYEHTGIAYNTFYTGTSVRNKYAIGSYSFSNWWLRSANSKAKFSTVSTNGAISSSSANASNGIVLGFCI